MSELKPVSPILVRQFERLAWMDPKQALIRLRRLEQNLPPELDERTRRLRTNELKESREARIAALFAYGISTAVRKHNVTFSKVEDSDYDCLLHWVNNNANYYVAVQIKELPPEDLNPRIDLDTILRGLNKYSGEQDLIVVVYLNRPIRFEYSPGIKRPDAKIRELWYLGCTSEDQSSWFIYGDVLAQIPLKYDFQYPQGQPNLS